MNKLYKCPECEGLSTIIEWEKVTLGDYTNREKRRKFIPFDSPMKEHINRKTIYKCPCCLKFIYRMIIKVSSINDDDIIKTK